METTLLREPTPVAGIQQRPHHATGWKGPHDLLDSLNRSPDQGLRYSHRVPREVQSTLTCLITGHAFTAGYRLKFKQKNLPPSSEEDVACACGAAPEDTEHVLLHCPLTHDQCLRHLSTDRLPDSLRKLISSKYCVTTIPQGDTGLF